MLITFERAVTIGRVDVCDRPELARLLVVQGLMMLCGAWLSAADPASGANPASVAVEATPVAIQAAGTYQGEDGVFATIDERRLVLQTKDGLAIGAFRVVRTSDGAHLYQLGRPSEVSLQVVPGGLSLGAAGESWTLKPCCSFRKFWCVRTSLTVLVE